MAFRSSKHQSILPAHVVPNGGLNVAVPPSAINDNELVIALNVWYSATTGKLTVRPGVEYIAKMADRPTNCHWYVKNSSTSYLIASCADDKIYYLDGSNVWQTLTTMSVSGNTPAFLTFNGKLLIADGSGLYSWDGVTTTITITTLTTTIKPDALREIGNRVVANDTADYDAVYFSGPEDETDWNTSTGNAIGLRAGYGDGLEVNAFAVFGMDLLVSKSGVGKRFYRINVSDSTPSNWYVSPLISDAAADHARMIAEVHNDVLFVDDGKLRSLAGVTQYGDLQIINIGNKVNPLIAYDKDNGKSPYFVRSIPDEDKVFIGHGGGVYVYHSPNGKFTKISFTDKVITTAVDAGGNIYIFASTGELYKFSDSLDTDELASGTTSNYTSIIRSKQFQFTSSEGIIRRVDAILEAITEGEAVLELIMDGNNAVSIRNITLKDVTDYYGSATSEYGDATDLLGDIGYATWSETSRNRARGFSFAVQLRTTSGRYAVERFDIISALVNG